MILISIQIFIYKQVWRQQQCDIHLIKKGGYESHNIYKIGFEIGLY